MSALEKPAAWVDIDAAAEGPAAAPPLVVARNRLTDSPFPGTPFPFALNASSACDASPQTAPLANVTVTAPE